MRRNRRDDDEYRETPPAVVAAVAAGTGALPFLAVYSVMFIVHGSVHPVVPPDVTSTKDGELAVGIVCLAALIVTLVSLFWLLNGRRRWPFVITQAALFGTTIDFVLDSTKGGRLISALVLLTSLVALVMSFHPQTSAHVRGTRPVPRTSHAPKEDAATG